MFSSKYYYIFHNNTFLLNRIDFNINQNCSCDFFQVNSSIIKKIPLRIKIIGRKITAHAAVDCYRSIIAPRVLVSSCHAAAN